MIVGKFYEIDKEELCHILSEASVNVRLMVTEREKIKGVPRKNVKFKEPIFGWEPVNEVNSSDLDFIMKSVSK